MKTFICLLALIAAVPALAQEVGDPDLRAELVQMLTADQEIRQRAIESGAFADPESIAAFAESDLGREMAAGDARRLARVEEIVAEHGWPSAALVGRDGSEAVFYIVQHAGPEVQQRMLALADAAHRLGDLDGSIYAMLLDRTLQGLGQPQVYGTQVAPGPDGTFTPTNLARPETVDARRAEIGLLPMEQYLALLEQAYDAQ